MYPLLSPLTYVSTHTCTQPPGIVWGLEERVEEQLQIIKQDNIISESGMEYAAAHAHCIQTTEALTQ